MSVYGSIYGSVYHLEEIRVVEWEDRRIEVEVGDRGPLGETRFLRRDDKIWEGGQALLESMRVGLEDLREKQVFRHQRIQTNRLRVEQVNPLGGRETLALQRDGQEWQLLSPVEGRVDGAREQNVGKPQGTPAGNFTLFSAMVAFEPSEFLAVSAVGLDGQRSAPSGWGAMPPTRPGQPQLQD